MHCVLRELPEAILDLLQMGGSSLRLRANGGECERHSSRASRSRHRSGRGPAHRRRKRRRRSWLRSATRRDSGLAVGHVDEAALRKHVVVVTPGKDWRALRERKVRCTSAKSREVWSIARTSSGSAFCCRWSSASLRGSAGSVSSAERSSSTISMSPNHRMLAVVGGCIYWKSCASALIPDNRGIWCSLRVTTDCSRGSSEAQTARWLWSL